jgi:hypothetical protein
VDQAEVERLGLRRVVEGRAVPHDLPVGVQLHTLHFRNE